MTIKCSGLKVSLPFKAGELPDINPDDPRFLLDMDGFKIEGKVNAKAARKAKTWPGGAVLQGRLVVQDRVLVLLDAGFTFNPPPAPTEEAAAPSGLPPTPK
jgi:hypothetical protein